MIKIFDSDKNLISPYITTSSDRQVGMRINEMITKGEKSWCLKQFSQLLPWKTYKK